MLQGPKHMWRRGSTGDKDSTPWVACLESTRRPYLCNWIVGDNHNSVCVWNPHVPQMPIVCQQLPVLLLSDVLQTICLLKSDQSS